MSYTGRNSGSRISVNLSKSGRRARVSAYAGHSDVHHRALVFTSSKSAQSYFGLEEDQTTHPRQGRPGRGRAPAEATTSARVAGVDVYTTAELEPVLQQTY